MARFIIVGAMRDSGAAIKVLVEAESAEAAEVRANRKGVLVESVTLEEPSQYGREIVPVVTRPVLQRKDGPDEKSSVGMSRTSTNTASSSSTTPQPWQPFVGVGQDSAVVERLYQRVLSVITSEEKIQVLVVQKKPIVNVSPDALAATNRRVICYRTKLLGRMSMDDFLWNRLSDAKIHDGFLGATISFSVIGAAPISMDHLPKEQARGFYRFAQQQEEAAIQSRRQLSLEEARAAAGGVTVQNLTQPVMSAGGSSPQTTLSTSPDPHSRLRQLKELADAGLISTSEYEKKKADILAAM